MMTYNLQLLLLLRATSIRAKHVARLVDIAHSTHGLEVNRGGVQSKKLGGASVVGDKCRSVHASLADDESRYGIVWDKSDEKCA
jgi:hypothetical protein